MSTTQLVDSLHITQHWQLSKELNKLVQILLNLPNPQLLLKYCLSERRHSPHSYIIVTQTFTIILSSRKKKFLIIHAYCFDCPAYAAILYGTEVTRNNLCMCVCMFLKKVVLTCLSLCDVFECHFIKKL